jgi:glycerol-3-phosphate acyltransferase PlsY
MTLWPGVFYVLLAFVSGSIPWSWILGKIRGVDIRKEGSGNTGATNLFRVCGRGIGFTGLFLDAFKGALPILAAKYGIAGFTPSAGQWVLAAASIFAVMGHVFSPWLGFRGGKGVATTFGVLMVLSPLTVAVGFAVFILIFSATRYVSLGSVSAPVAMIPAVFILEPAEPSVQIIICLVAVLIVVRHKSNIVRLLRGEENKFSFRGGKDD